MSTDLNGVLGFMGKVLPWVGAIATGNIPGLIALAADKIGEATGTKVEATQDGIATAIAAVKDPEVMLKLKQVDADLQIHLQQMGFENVQALEKLAAEDRASARDRDVQITRVQGHNYRADVLAFLAIGAMGFAGYALFKLEIPQANREMLMALIGALTIIVKDIYGFEFSTTRSSQLNNEAIREIAKS